MAFYLMEFTMDLASIYGAQIFQMREDILYPTIFDSRVNTLIYLLQPCIPCIDF